MSVVWANLALLDRLVISSDDFDVGIVDDLELSDGDQPELTAFLCGPTALGPRMGDHLGVWWLAIGRRLRPDGDPYPNRIPIELITSLDHRGVALRVTADEVSTQRMHRWALHKVVGRIPGNGS